MLPTAPVALPPPRVPGGAGAGPAPAHLVEEQADALRQLAARVRRVEAAVAEQLSAGAALTSMDWHGRAAAAFLDAVAVRGRDLQRLSQHLGELSDLLERRAAAAQARAAAAAAAALTGLLR